MIWVIYHLSEFDLRSKQTRDSCANLNATEKPQTAATNLLPAFSEPKTLFPGNTQKRK